MKNLAGIMCCKTATVQSGNRRRVATPGPVQPLQVCDSAVADLQRDRRVPATPPSIVVGVMGVWLNPRFSASPSASPWMWWRPIR
jgi:hypothetical protein